jgi:hypothetical protein
VTVAFGLALQAGLELVIQVADQNLRYFRLQDFNAIMIANIWLAKNMHNSLYFDAEGFLRVWHSNCGCRVPQVPILGAGKA